MFAGAGAERRAFHFECSEVAGADCVGISSADDFDCRVVQTTNHRGGVLPEAAMLDTWRLVTCTRAARRASGSDHGFLAVVQGHGPRHVPCLGRGRRSARGRGVHRPLLLTPSPSLPARQRRAWRLEQAPRPQASMGAGAGIAASGGRRLERAPRPQAEEGWSGHRGLRASAPGAGPPWAGWSGART